MASVTEERRWSSERTIWFRRCAPYSRGERPMMDLNRRWKWKGLRWAAEARSASLGVDSAVSISRQAATTASFCRSRGEAALGVQRLQGRKPARSASAAELWKATLAREARREGQAGRQ